MAVEGFHKDIPFRVKIIASDDYPFAPPKVMSTTRVLHPNIHIETGEVFISMLQKTEWIPVLNLNLILFALELILIQPNMDYIPDCFKNQELLQVYQFDQLQFRGLIQQSMLWGDFDFYSSIYSKNDQQGMATERQYSGMKAIPNNGRMQQEGIVRSLKFDFEGLEPKKNQIIQSLQEHLFVIKAKEPGSKKRKIGEEDVLINPYLKKVRITPMAPVEHA